MRKTKIIATLGPACDSESAIRDLALAGMNVARINLSHGDQKDIIDRITKVKKVSRETELPIAVMLDTRGPEIRLQKFENDSVEVSENEKFILRNSQILGDNTQASVSFDGFYKSLKTGDLLLMCDGLVKMVVEKIEGTDICLNIMCGGTLSNNKSINAPGVKLDMPYLNDADKSDLLVGIANDIDFVASSFVSKKQDVEDIKAFLRENGGADIDVVAKIESVQGIENLSEILPISDGIMVARGDLGVEFPYEKLPPLQKELVKRTREMGKRVIVATEMLESMIKNPRPTRAETSDVANAVYDGASAIMLSGETAAGKYPKLAVKTMAAIAEYTESCIHYKKRFAVQDFKIKNIADCISNSAVKASFDLECSAILVVTESGASARMVSRFRPTCPIIAITPNVKTYYKLAMSWGVVPVLGTNQTSSEELFRHATTISKQKGLIAVGQKVITVSSTSVGQVGLTNLMKLDLVL
ncbi:MAG: pyruvate kinase [Clostridia bacterium]